MIWATLYLLVAFVMLALMHLEIGMFSRRNLSPLGRRRYKSGEPQRMDVFTAVVWPLSLVVILLFVVSELMERE